MVYWTPELRAYQAYRRMVELLALGSIATVPRECHYVPPLMDQIRRGRAFQREGRIVAVRVRGDQFVPEVDPKTRASTGVAQQFLLKRDGSMRPLPRDQWVDDPEIADVAWMSYR